MGAELIVGSALAGLGLIGSTISTSEANSTARSENAQNRAYNAYEAEKQRQWSTNERLAAQAYNTSEREAVQRYQTASVGQNVMNSINAMRAAGVNANVLGSSAINTGATGSPAGSSSPASGGAASYGTGMTPQIMQIPQLMQGASGFINALSKNVETRANLPLIDANVKLALEKMYGQQKANELQDLYVKFEKANLPTKIKKSMEEYVALTLQNGNAVRQGRVFEKQEDLLEAKKRVQDMIAKLKGAEAIQAQFYADRVVDIYDADMKLKGAQTRQANAQAVESGTQAEQNLIFNKIYGDKRYQHSLVTQAVEAGRQAVTQNKISKSQAEHMTYLVEQAAYANDMKEFTYWSNQVNGFVNTLGQAASQFYGAGALRELIKLRQGQQSPLTPIKGFGN